ncbi:MAG TPA: formyltransferase family protein [Oligoflexia bacterium]|nr:formyltransferase family protein [Oligoflexia bacterium]HMP47482.1 formyltransferase family protein [Oligoflexia bacterium]
MNILFIANDYSLHNHLLESLIRQNPADNITIIKVSLVLKGKGRIDSASRIFPKLSKRYLFQKTFEYLLLSIITYLPKFYFKGEVFRKLSRIAKKYNCNYFETDNILSEDSLHFIKGQRPDIIFTLFHQIIKSELINIPELGVINIHPGLLPDTKGIQPYFWNLISNSKSKSGVTFHYITDETIDTGDIIGTAGFVPWKGISVQLNYYLTIKCAVAAIGLVLDKIKSGNISSIPQSKDEGQYHTWPDTKNMDSLYNMGYQLISFRDLYGILLGTYDTFKPEFIHLCSKEHNY